MLFHDAAMMTISIASAPTMFGSHIPGQMSFRKAKKPTAGLEDELEGDGGRGRGHRIGPHQHRAVNDQPPDHPVHEDRQQEREPHGDRRRPEGEDEGDAGGFVIFRRTEEFPEIV